MWKKRIIIILTLVTLIIIASVSIFKYKTVEALSKYGSRGNEVTQIQTKLKRWGYYNGNIDGIFGSQTLAAVKSFQKKKIIRK